MDQHLLWTLRLQLIYLTDSYVTSQQVGGANRINLTGASPDFTRDEFLAHVQARVNEALNSYADNATQKAALGIEKLQFTRASGTTIDTIYETNDIIQFTHTSNEYAGAGNVAILQMIQEISFWYIPILITNQILVFTMGKRRLPMRQLTLTIVQAMAQMQLVIK